MTSVLIGNDAPSRPRRRVLSRGVPSLDSMAPVIGVAATFVLWVVGGRAGWAKGMIVTPAEALAPIFGDNADIYRRATVATVSAALRGFVIGGLVAFLAALLAATVPSLRRSIVRLATIANAAPWVAVAPCMLIVLGRDRGPAAVAALAVFFVVFVSTSLGLGATSSTSYDVLQALGAPRRRHVRFLQLPGSWPSVIDGLKLGAPAAMAGAVFGEWYGAPRGLGVLLIGAMQSGRAERLWAASLLAAGCGLVAYAVLGVLQRAMSNRFGTSVTQAADTSTSGRSGWSSIGREAVVAVVVTVVLVGMWWTWIEVSDISPLVVPRPSRVWSELTATPGDFVTASMDTLETSAIALVLGSALGLLAAVASSRSRFLGGMVVPLVVVLAATPLVALLPLFARIFGYQPNTVRILAAVMVFFPVFVYTRSGLGAATRSTTDVLSSLGASNRRRFRLLDLPAAAPHLASGFRLAAGSAVIAAVVGESLIGADGLGVMFAAAYRLLDLPRAFGAAIVIVVVSVAVFAAAGALERAVHTRWS